MEGKQNYSKKIKDELDTFFKQWECQKEQLQKEMKDQKEKFGKQRMEQKKNI